EARGPLHDGYELAHHVGRVAGEDGGEDLLLVLVPRDRRGLDHDRVLDLVEAAGVVRDVVVGADDVPVADVGAAVVGRRACRIPREEPDRQDGGGGEAEALRYGPEPAHSPRLTVKRCVAPRISPNGT